MPSLIKVCHVAIRADTEIKLLASLTTFYLAFSFDLTVLFHKHSSTMTTFPYRQVLMVGATAGIGAAMADRLILEGTKVIAVGRRQDRLDAFVQKHGAQKACAVRFDISDRQNIGKFVSEITKTYSELDCVFLNAGVQSVVNLREPEKVDLPAFHSEISTNFSAFVDLTVRFLPFLMSKKTETSLI